MLQTIAFSGHELNHSSNLPGRKFSIIMSESEINFLTSSKSLSILRFFLITDFPKFTEVQYAATCSFSISVNGGPHPLVSSPQGASTLRTVAPKSESNFAVYGPANTLDKSRTLTPSKGLNIYSA